MLSFSIELDYDDFFVEIKTTKAKKMRASSAFFFNGIQKDALEFSKGHIFSRKWQKCNFNGKKSYLSSTFLCDISSLLIHYSELYYQSINR